MLLLVSRVFAAKRAGAARLCSPSGRRYPRITGNIRILRIIPGAPQVSYSACDRQLELALGPADVSGLPDAVPAQAAEGVLHGKPLFEHIPAVGGILELAGFLQLTLIRMN